MWYDPQAGFAVIVPMATDPEFRKLGLGKALFLEGIKRVTNLGAKFVYVGSSQLFYYSICGPTPPPPSGEAKAKQNTARRVRCF